MLAVQLLCLYSWARREVKLLNKEFEEASTHTFVVDLDLLDLKARVAHSERLQAQNGWQFLPASPRVSRVQRYTACSTIAMVRMYVYVYVHSRVNAKVTCYI